MNIEFDDDEFDYKLKIFSKYNVLECYKNNILYYTCDTLDNRVPEESIMLARKVFYTEGEVLDVGSGTGIILLELCKRYGDLRCIGAEIDELKYGYAERNINKNDLGKRCYLFACSYKDIPIDKLFKVRIVVSNPPLIPGELGFWETNEEGFETPVYENLLNWIGINFCSNIKVYLHVFDYVGIAQRTGAYKCLSEIALELGFKMVILDSIQKEIKANSNILKKRSDIAKIFPKGYIIRNTSKIQFEQFKDEILKSNENIFLPCSLICFIKCKRTIARTPTDHAAL